MVDERVMERWMALEMRGLAEGLVRVPRPLADLLAEEEPSAPTASGVHRFDVRALREVAGRIDPLTRARLRLPILVTLDRETPGSAYVASEAAQDALREAGVARGEPRDGKLWWSEALAREAARRWPTIFQFVLL